jgi:hypothetical protein
MMGRSAVPRSRLTYGEPGQLPQTSRYGCGVKGLERGGASYGACSTCLQAAGKSANVNGGLGFGGVVGGLGCSTGSLNQ